MANEKIIDKIRKIVLLAESEEQLGHEEAAINIGNKAREMLKQYKLSHEDLNLIAQTEPEYIPPVMGKSMVMNPFLRANSVKAKRMIWFEELGKVIAEQYFCKAEVENNSVYFYGLDMDREVATFMFLKIAEKAKAIHDVEIKKAQSVIGAKRISFGGAKSKLTEEIPKEWIGDDIFSSSFHYGFRQAIAESYEKDETSNNSQKSVEDYIEHNFVFVENDYAEMFNDRNAWANEIGRKYGLRVSNNLSSKTTNGNSSGQAVIKSEIKREVQKGGDYYFLLDISGSMCGEKLILMKEAVKDVAKDLVAADYKVGLIAFNHNSHHVMSLTNDLVKFNVAVDSLQSSGGTSLEPSLNQAMMRFRNYKVKRIVCVVTDGQTSYQNKCLQTGQVMKSSGIEIRTIGTEDADKEFLTELASKGFALGGLKNNELGDGVRKMAGMLGA
jgi:Mg-chelatase subunit ChlD